ncbi:hypothetical protein Ae201684P_018465 [Aphanomyces euteiches]|uniref:Uncharacterized protein n=1 Tax=Aphanomyces euteiches TaxID=100861 RepID=A0A6G0XVF2_9STRA|nr:hypothetical protein Ae201684_001121 [Aphanomyces euteiches]KAH9099450.1 hypothetical protein Ae201684P_018465 [Aphanomyces euteiches]
MLQNMQNRPSCSVLSSKCNSSKGELAYKDNAALSKMVCSSTEFNHIAKTKHGRSLRGTLGSIHIRAVAAVEILEDNNAIGKEGLETRVALADNARICLAVDDGSAMLGTAT